MSSFQLHFADFDIRTPGDRPDVLVAMNPAALKANLQDLPCGAVIIADATDFNLPRNLAKVGYQSNPLDDGSLEAYQVHALDLTGLAVGAVGGLEVGPQGGQPHQEHVRPGPADLAVQPSDEGTLDFLATKFANRPEIRDANTAAFRAGYAHGETTESFSIRCNRWLRPRHRAPTARSPATRPWRTG